MEKRIDLSVNATGRLRRCGTMSIDGGLEENSGPPPRRREGV